MFFGIDYLCPKLFKHQDFFAIMNFDNLKGEKRLIYLT